MPDIDKDARKFERMARVALECAAEDKRELKTIDDLIGYLKVECRLTDEFVDNFNYAQLRKMKEDYYQMYADINDTPLDDVTVPAVPADTSNGTTASVDAGHEARAQSMDSGYGTMRTEAVEKMFSEILGDNVNLEISLLPPETTFKKDADIHDMFIGVHDKKKKESFVNSRILKRLERFKCEKRGDKVKIRWRIENHDIIGETWCSIEDHNDDRPDIVLGLGYLSKELNNRLLSLGSPDEVNRLDLPEDGSDDGSGPDDPISPERLSILARLNIATSDALYSRMKGSEKGFSSSQTVKSAY